MHSPALRRNLSQRKEVVMKHGPFINSTVILFFLLSLLVATPHTIQAQENEIDQLHRKITELEDRIKDLEIQLEGCSELRDKEWRTGGWRNKKNWRKLGIGMPQEEVEALLGEPVKVIQGIRTLWYYPNIYCGYVSFDENGHLTGWSEP